MAVKEMTQEQLVEALAIVEELKAKNLEQEEELKGMKAEAEEVRLELDEIKRIKADEEAEEEASLEAQKTKSRKGLNAAMRSGAGRNAAVIDGGKIKSQDGKINGSEIPQYSEEIVERMVETSRITSLFETGSTKNTDYSYPVEKGATGASWGDGYGDGTGEFEWVKATFGKATAAPKISLDTLDDSFTNLDSWLQDRLATDFGVLGAQGLLTGTGTGDQPLGYLKYFDKVEGAKDQATRKVTHYACVDATAAKTKYDVIDALFDLTVDINAEFIPDSVYAMSRKAYKMISKVRDEEGLPLIRRSDEDANKFMLNGFPVIVDPLFPADAPVVFGSIGKSFKVLSLPVSLRVLRNDYAVNGMVTWPSSMRVGCHPTQNRAVIGLFLPDAMPKQPGA
ncbi:phage major capsid protein [Aeromonas hydrophila]|uniref:phage major capsid protein n=1 Tax=Aeromonas hydrophila TaxID=644 RepID=UPI003D259526